MTTRWTRRSPSRVAASDELAVVLGASRSTVWSSQVSGAAAFVHELLAVSSWSIVQPCLYIAAKGLILWSVFFLKFDGHPLWWHMFSRLVGILGGASHSPSCLFFSECVS